MELPGPPTHSRSSSRAPGSGLKLMLGILVVFLLLAAYGQWERSRRAKTETAVVLPAPDVSSSPAAGVP